MTDHQKNEIAVKVVTVNVGDHANYQFDRQEFDPRPVKKDQR